MLLFTKLANAVLPDPKGHAQDFLNLCYKRKKAILNFPLKPIFLPSLAQLAGAWGVNYEPKEPVF